MSKRNWIIGGVIVFFAVIIVAGAIGEEDEGSKVNESIEELEDARGFQKKVFQVLEEGNAASVSVTGSLLASDIVLYRRAKSAHETWADVRSKLNALDRERPAKQFDEPMSFLTIAANYRKDAFKAVMVWLDDRKPSEMVKYQERMERADELQGAGLTLLRADKSCRQRASDGCFKWAW